MKWQVCVECPTLGDVFVLRKFWGWHAARRAKRYAEERRQSVIDGVERLEAHVRQAGNPSFSYVDTGSNGVEIHCRQHA